MDWGERPEITGDQHLRVDVKDPTAVIDALRAAGIGSVWLAYTSIDVAVPSVAAIHRAVGLSTPSPDVSDAPLAKSTMTDRWRRDGLLNRLSVVVSRGDVAAVKEACSHCRVIVKPDLSSSSRGITILPAGADSAACASALARAQEASFDGNAIVEEFFEGREFTVEMLGDGFGNVSTYALSVKYHSDHAGANKVANKLHYNSTLFADSVYDRIAEYARRCYRSVGLSTSFGHLEILMRDDGLLSPVEIGARSTGFVCSPIADVVSGRDYLDDYASILRGGRVEECTLRSGMSGVYFFYDFPPGFVCGRLASLEDFLSPEVRSLYFDRDAIQVGRRYGRIDNDTERWGYEVLVGPRNALTIEAVESAEGRLLRTLEEVP